MSTAKGEAVSEGIKENERGIPVSNTPITDDTKDAYLRGACGVFYILEKLKGLESDNAALREEIARKDRLIAKVWTLVGHDYALMELKQILEEALGGGGGEG